MEGSGTGALSHPSVTESDACLPKNNYQKLGFAKTDLDYRGPPLPGNYWYIRAIESSPLRTDSCVHESP